MASLFDPPPSPYSFSKPKPRPPKSPAQVAHIRVRNRRREYLERNPDYLKSAEHEFADPLLYDSLIRHFHTPAEREAEGREKGYSRTLESSLLRGEARLAKLASTTQEAGDTSGGGGGDELPDADEPPTSGAEVPAASLVVGSAAGTTTTGFEIDVAIAPPATTREEGRERWEEFLRDRFVRGGDDEFEYRGVDENDDLDVLERKDREEEWFDDETPDWASTPRAEEELEEEEEQKMKEGEDRGGMRPERILHGETGVQDF